MGGGRGARHGGGGAAWRGEGKETRDVQKSEKDEKQACVVSLPIVMVTVISSNCNYSMERIRLISSLGSLKTLVLCSFKK